MLKESKSPISEAQNQVDFKVWFKGIPNWNWWITLQKVNSTQYDVSVSLEFFYKNICADNVSFI